MKISAVIAEYNLIHNGHIKQFRLMSEHDGTEAVKLAVMSGNYVQRGELAVLDKYTRAEAAVKCGADIVLELPFPWSCSGAEFFASAAVDLICGIAKSVPQHEFRLCFGSESGDISEIELTAERLSDEKYNSILTAERSAKTQRSESDIRLRSRIYKEIFGKELFRTPNDILGVEYIRALKKQKCRNVIPYTVRREGTESAGMSRKFYRGRNMQELRGICPEAIFQIAEKSTPVSIEKIYPAVVSWLLFSEKNPSPNTDGMTEDLLYRFISAAKNSRSFDELIRRTATKKYTDARLRRTLLLGFFGVTTEMLRVSPDFSFILGLSPKGREFLSLIRKGYSGPELVTAPADSIAERAKLALRADSLYAVAENLPPSYFVKKHPFILY